MPSSIRLTSSAYSLLILHAAAHPQSTVTGFLLGKVDGSGDADGELTVDEVVPLAHHWNHLGTVEDVGLELLTSHLASTSSKLSVIGVYEAPAKGSAIVLSHSALRLAGKVSQQIAKGKSKEIDGGAGGRSRQACLALLLQNGSVLQPTSHALKPFFVPPSSSAQTFNQDKLAVEDAEETIRTLTEAVRTKGAWKAVRDLDDHLEDTSVDWLNNKLIASQRSVTKA
ncbi:hypothetical protein BCV69DRAFT_185371 [Microstroma glucosiphilum]|uniref:Uncharacterized protein n=1 Tax=Pseudomicrostroma glucosiphilum TaxID=1684307 RepID=A0A316U8C4_9BASI|nr:hypothetical protein BCV69DRAFT_185371 [Pseudomicrostroma glucosiphilum]PWN21104.1 hypothetical protein BCV69DRAFT_185371 [Pseudomicrostroma glucosiphilum]